MTLGSGRYSELLVACNAIQKLKDAAIYGARHSEVRQLKILEKFGSRPQGASITRSELREAAKEVSAIDSARDSPTVEIQLETKDLELIRQVIRHQLRMVRGIPQLARRQSVVALCATYEGFVDDVIRQVYDVEPRVLKSGKNTLSDSDLVDGIESGDPLELLKDRRARDVMFGSVAEWMTYFRKELGFDLAPVSGRLTQMFLIRNAIVHSNGRVTHELASHSGSRFKSVGRELNVTERDLQQYTDSVRASAGEIWSARVSKFPT